MEAELESVRQYVITHIDMIDESFGMLQKLISMQNVEIHVILGNIEALRKMG